MTTEKKRGHDVRSIDGFGVIEWDEGKDPVGAGADPAAMTLHGDLKTARAIAISLFGGEWRDFVMDVYDRLIALDGEEPGDEKGG